MKKLIFMLAFVLMSSITFANNSTKEAKKTGIEITKVKLDEFGICTYTLTRTTIDSNGEFHTDYKTFRRYAVSEADCRNLAKLHVDSLNQGMAW